MIETPASEIDDIACRWAARIDRGLSADEAAALARWVAADVRHDGALVRARATLSLLDRARVLPANEDDGRAAPTIGRRALIGGGAGFAAALAAGLGWRWWPRGVAVATRVGEIRHLPLSDGSLAVVNSGSAMRIDYIRARRGIDLAQGEAWFQVAKNTARPFTVAAGPIRVEAVGTAFDVRRHAEMVEVIVTEGTVRLWSTSGGGAARLVHHGERALIDDRGGVAVSTVSALAAAQQLAWREHRIVLDDVTLGAAADEFNRYHDIRLTIDPALAQRRMIGWFSTDDLDGFVAASARIVGARVERGSGEIRIVR